VSWCEVVSQYWLRGAKIWTGDLQHTKESASDTTSKFDEKKIVRLDESNEKRDDKLEAEADWEREWDRKQSKVGR